MAGLSWLGRLVGRMTGVAGAVIPAVFVT